MQNRVCMLLLMLGLFSSHINAQRGVPGGQSPFPGSGGAGGGGNFPSTGYTPAFSDSLGDSIQGPKIKPDTRYIDRKQLFTHADEIKFREERAFEDSYYWDPLDKVNGFYQSLGQIGKPYLAYYDGFREDMYDLDYWRNPVLGRYNRHALNPETQTKYFDTRTPYVNVDYLQGPAELQLIGVTISQNITPFWNAAIYFHRRQSVGVYRNFVTDHSNMYFSSNFRTKDNKYHLFGNITYNKLSDQMNGGTPRRNDDAYPVIDGIIYEVPTFYNNAFFKGLSSPNLTTASAENKVTSFYVDHYYHLIGESDSVEKHHKLTLRNTITQEFLGNRYVNNSINGSGLASNLFPVYPTVPTDSGRVIEGYGTDRFKIAGEGSYSFEVGKGYGLNINGGLSYQTLGFIKDTALVRENATRQYANAELVLPLITLNGKISQRFSDVFKAERTLSLGGVIKPFPEKPLYRVKGFEADTESRFESQAKSKKKEAEKPPAMRDPLTLHARYDIRDLNPSLYQTYFVGDSGNTYRPNPDLNNQTLNHIEAGLSYNFATPVRRKDTLLANYISLKGFFSGASGFIYYNTRLQQLQAGQGEGLNWVGAEASFRVRFLRKLYFESRVGYQQGSAGGNNDFLNLYAAAIPDIYGKSSLYYHSQKVSFAQMVRIGVDVYYNTNYVGQTLDPLSGEFFPVNYNVPGYARIDAYAAMKIMGVYVYGKFVHVNEGLLLAGYYTTPFYPMLERSFTLGIYWSFFD